MAIPMTMLLDHSGSSLPPSPWLPLRPPYPLPLQGFRLVFSTTACATLATLSLSSLVCATVSQQLRIVAVKYNGQDNDSVIYPRFGPLSARLFPTLEENNRRRFVPSFSSLSPFHRPWPPLSRFSRRFTPANDPCSPRLN